MPLRHTPTLYTHKEVKHEEFGEDEDEEEEPLSKSLRFMSTANHSNSLSRSHSTRAEVVPPLSHSSSDSTLYSEWIGRYRSRGEVNDPDNHFVRQGLGQLLEDQGDSDDEEGALDHNLDGITAVEHDQIPKNDLEKERLSWQYYLARVLGGNVLKSEKTRISEDINKTNNGNEEFLREIWYGLRARMHSRSEEEEKARIEEKRIRIVDSAIDEVTSFRIDGSSSDDALAQVTNLLKRIEVVHSLYPSLKALHNEKSVFGEDSVFEQRLNALNTWSSIFSSLNQQLLALQHWTGSPSLDVTQPNTSAEAPITGSRNSSPISDGTSFVERMLKEESTQVMFEKGIMTTTNTFISSARKEQIVLYPLFSEMNLPTFEQALVPLISFPTRLAQAALQVRYDYVASIEEPTGLILDEMTDDVKIGIGLACTLKRQYDQFRQPDPNGYWNVPDCLSEGYDDTILHATKQFFELLHYKLKSSSKNIYFKETDVLESQWATMDDVSMTVSGGSLLVAEQLCTITNKLMVRVINYFDSQVRVAAEKEHAPEPVRVAMNGALSGNHNDAQHDTKVSFNSQQQKVDWYAKILDSVRHRYRKIQRFARVLTQRFSNSAEYNLSHGKDFSNFIEQLVSTDHFLVYTNTYEEDGIYIIASGTLRGKRRTITRMLTEAFHVDEPNSTRESGTEKVPAESGTSDGGIESEKVEGQAYGIEPNYLIILYPTNHWFWRGPVEKINLPSPRVDLDPKDDFIRLISDGPSRRLSLAKRVFSYLVDGNLSGENPDRLLSCTAEHQAHLPAVNRQLRKITHATMRLAESIVDSMHQIRNSMEGHQELVENWYSFSSEHGQHALKYMDNHQVRRFNPLLIRLAISWVSFICDDCDPKDTKTFRWAVNALEFTYQRTRRNILHLPEDQYRLLKHKVATCIHILSNHFDLYGARTQAENKRKQQTRNQKSRSFTSSLVVEDELAYPDPDFAFIDPGARKFWERVMANCQELDQRVAGNQPYGTVLDAGKSEDRMLVSLASSSAHIGIRWQQGKHIGSGAFGNVFLAVNLSSGSVMAVKEIKFPDFQIPGKSNMFSQIRDELEVMERLHHPNVVEYYGIEVHRDKVYIFEEYCQGGSLAALLAYGRIEDEFVLQLYSMQMVEGLAYLHSKNIAHRDIKPDNILLDDQGTIKFADFGAAKILVQNQRSIQRSRRGEGGNNNSITGTPMYMAPEVIRNNKIGRQGAMDIWATGCVVLECCTGRRPWNNVDNEWAIMFRIGKGEEHPQMPDKSQLSAAGIRFIEKCLTIDPMRRPTAQELFDYDEWIVDIRLRIAEMRKELDQLEQENASSGAEVIQQTVADESAYPMQRDMSMPCTTTILPSELSEMPQEP